jgi:hypothetical protein
MIHVESIERENLVSDENSINRFDHLNIYLHEF